MKLTDEQHDQILWDIEFAILHSEYCRGMTVGDAFALSAQIAEWTIENIESESFPPSDEDEES